MSDGDEETKTDRILLGGLFVILMTFLGWGIMVSYRQTSSSSDPAEPIERRTTIGPPPAYRTAADPGLRPRWVDVEIIAGAADLDPEALAAEVNRLLAEVHPAVAIASVTLSWPPSGRDAYLLITWERNP